MTWPFRARQSEAQAAQARAEQAKQRAATILAMVPPAGPKPETGHVRADHLKVGDIVQFEGYPADLVLVERTFGGCIFIRWSNDLYDCAILGPAAVLEVLNP